MCCQPPTGMDKNGRESAQMKQNVQSPRLPALNTAKARLRALMQPCLEDKRERLVGERQRQKDRLTDRTRDRESETDRDMEREAQTNSLRDRDRQR